MEFFLFLLFAWCTQCAQAQIKRSQFQFNASIYDDHTIYNPYGGKIPAHDRSEYHDKLCDWILSTIPKNLTQQESGTSEPACDAFRLSGPINHTMEYKITLYLQTTTSTGPLINLTCPTFGESFTYMLMHLSPILSHSDLQFTVHNYQPKGIPFDLRKAADVEFNVKAYLCDREEQPIPVDKAGDYNDTFLMSAIKLNSYVILGYWMINAPEIKLTQLTKRVESGKIYVDFVLFFPKMHVLTLKINPYCDTANILQMILSDKQRYNDFRLCGITVEVTPPPTETPLTMTPLPLTTTSDDSHKATDLASATRGTMEVLVCVLIFSQFLANT